MRVGWRIPLAALVAALCAGAGKVENEGSIGCHPAGGRIPGLRPSMSANSGASKWMLGSASAAGAETRAQTVGSIGPGEGMVMRLRGGVVDAFSPYSNKPMAELSDYMMKDPNWCPTSSTEETEEDGSQEELDAETKPSDNEQKKQQPAINATDRIMLDDEEPISDAEEKGKKKRKSSRPEYERTSMAPGIKRNDLPCLTAEELDELEREHDNVHYFDHHESEWSDECLWCSKTWAKLVKLLAAARDGDTEMVISSLEEGANVNGGDVTHQNWTAVHYAAYYGHAAVIEVLTQSGADVNAADVMKWTPLHYAALKGRYDACLALLSCGANTSALTEKGKPPLQKAVYLQQVDCIHLLCEWTGENPQPLLRVVNTSDTWIPGTAKKVVGEGEGRELEREERRLKGVKKALGGHESSDLLTAESSEERNRREGGEGGGGGGKGNREGRANGVLLNDDEAEIEAEEKVLTDEEEANLQEIRNEYERKFREIKNRDGRFQD